LLITKLQSSEWLLIWNEEVLQRVSVGMNSLLTVKKKEGELD